MIFRRSITGLIRTVLHAVIFLFLLLGLAQPAKAQVNNAIVRMENPVFEVGMGQVETLVIVLENAQDVYGIDLRAAFDPAYVEVADSDPAKNGTQLIPGDFIKPDFLVRNEADNQAGTLIYVATQVNPTLPATGSGAVLSIQLRGLKMGKSAFTITSVQIADRQGNLLPVSSEDGSIVVGTPKPPTPTPPTSKTPSATPTADGIEGIYPTNTPIQMPAAVVATPLPGSGGVVTSKMLIWVIVISLVGALMLFAAIYWFGLRRPPE
jgi:hypothetical protein